MARWAKSWLIAAAAAAQVNLNCAGTHGILDHLAPWETLEETLPMVNSWAVDTKARTKGPARSLHRLEWEIFSQIPVS